MTKQINRKNQQRGYSIVELLISLSLISIFSALAAPSLVRTYRSYQMDDVASQVASQIKFVRYEAIRRNFSIQCLNNPQGAQGLLTIFGVDPKAPNNNVQANEKQMVFAANAIATTVSRSSGISLRSVCMRGGVA